ncbi:AFR376Wp [Eremothecium gossypii ATCC 10895]|uniref:AFR376Wp n=1 Tax=Eremothecium gossypii (strain ATCC 10895 / CBS 109.51 / FGSC 9923 / NRRL Y-1056) TaxID=284811 RepID=Q753E0_EREGS|nr:AFR376Wp [Eremothecium gossypii ATCC 10895]AAS53747.1 AFR376Wp [Eremothecium gossypii ATCC 10895]
MTQYVDQLEFSSYPSGKAQGKHHIVIVGAGIIGVCTAYYLTRHAEFDSRKYHITVIESKRVAGGASGKAGGLLAKWAFPQQIVPLSFQLHQELADECDGATNWDYRRLTTVSLEADVQEEDGRGADEGSGSTLEGERSPSKKLSRATNAAADQEAATLAEDGLAGGGAVNLPEDLNWIRKHLVRDWSSLGGTGSTAQVHPYKFCHYLLNKAMETGAVDLILGKVTQILFDDRFVARGVSYMPNVDSPEEQTEVKEVSILGTQQVVLCMGPWTSRILPDCPISGLRAHSITIKPSTGTVSPYAIFTELKVDSNKYFSPEIYARKDEVYVCGEGDTLVELPETTDAVEVVREKCDELYRYVSKLSPNLSEGHILKRQACYLPVLNVPTSSGPLIGETNVEGLYLASGHSCWGINNAPATGKIMSELLLEGEAKSADISALDPGLYFDASVLE